MLGYALRRLLWGIPVAFSIAVFVFSTLHLVPGDPVLMLLGSSSGLFNVTPELIEETRQQYGLNDPLPVQFARWAGNLLRGDLGLSIRIKRPVTTLILERIPPTIELTLAGMAVGTLLGFGLGLIAALKRDSWVDTLCMVAALVGVSMPSFWFGFLLIFLFSLTLAWLPATGYGGLDRLILPAITLGFALSAVTARLVRAAVIEVLAQEYVTTARAKGLRETVILYRHVLKNVMIPVITILGVQFGSLLSGSVIIEAVFARQGIGQLLVDAILAKDFPVVQGVTLVMAIAYVLLNILVDISYPLFDPRILYK
ncbi:MAG: ABC transporter permease [Chloroflexi bacterium]|nr:ABC transporter permease [Chloroflexota bacterium]MBI3734794.1 ABC transporter permease [Chloroflexota bacterium]